MHKNLSAKFDCPSQKVWDIIEKSLHWASVVRDFKEYLDYQTDRDNRSGEAFYYKNFDKEGQMTKSPS